MTFPFSGCHGEAIPGFCCWSSLKIPWGAGDFKSTKPMASPIGIWDPKMGATVVGNLWGIKLLPFFGGQFYWQFIKSYGFLLLLVQKSGDHKCHKVFHINLNCKISSINSTTPKQTNPLDTGWWPGYTETIRQHCLIRNDTCQSIHNLLPWHWRKNPNLTTCHEDAIRCKLPRNIYLYLMLSEIPYDCW